MKEFIAAGVQFSVKPNDIEENIKRSLFWLEKAVKEHQAQLIVFPETITTGFTPAMPTREFWKILDYIPGKTTEPICEAAYKYGVHVVYATYERGEDEETIYNTAVLINDEGKIAGKYRKTHPFPTERKEGGGWTTPGNEAVVVDTKLGKIGMIICYDGDFPELCRVEAIKGAEIIVRPSALLRSYDIWQFVNQARAYDNHVYFIAVNSVGLDAAGNSYFGNSMIIDPTGWKLAQARGCDEIISAKLDPDPIKYVSHGTKSPMIFDHMEDRNLNVYKDILTEAKCPFEPFRRIPYKR